MSGYVTLEEIEALKPSCTQWPCIRRQLACIDGPITVRSALAAGLMLHDVLWVIQIRAGHIIPAWMRDCAIYLYSKSHPRDPEDGRNRQYLRDAIYLYESRQNVTAGKDRFEQIANIKLFSVQDPFKTLEWMLSRLEYWLSEENPIPLGMPDLVLSPLNFEGAKQ